MNILFLNSIEKETYGGMEEWIRLTAGALRKRGHDIIVAGRTGSEYLRRVAESTKDAIILGLHISGDFDPFTISRLKKIINKNKIQIIVANFNKDIRLGGLAALIAGGSKVIWSAGINLTKNNWVHRTLTPKLIDGVIVPSLYLKNAIITPGYINPSIVNIIPIGIPNGVPRPSKREISTTLKSKYNLPLDSLISVTAGRFVPQKGHIHLIEATPMIVKNHPNMRFIFLGSGPLEGKLRNRISGLGLDQYFVFAGMLDDITVALHGADLMIHPSIEEPFGIALLEGMRAGLPIVASNVGGIPEVVDENNTAHLVPPADSKALANTVSDLLGSPSEMIDFGRKGRERWENRFKLESMIDRIEKYFLSLVGN